MGRTLGTRLPEAALTLLLDEGDDCANDLLVLVAFVLLIPLIALLLGVFYMRLRIQSEQDKRRDTYVVSFPSDLSSDQLKDWMHSISGSLRSKSFLGIDSSPSVAFEVWSDVERGLVQRLHLPESAYTAIGQLREFVPDVVVVPAMQARKHNWSCVIEVGESNPDRLLRFDPNILARSLRKALRPDDLRPGEELLLQVVVSPCPPRDGQPQQQQMFTTPLLAIAGQVLNPASKKQAAAEAKEKLAETNFEAILRIAANAKTEGRAKALAEGVRSALRSVNGANNKFVRTKVPTSQLHERIANATSPVIWPARLSVSELSGLIAWPLSNPHNREAADQQHLWPEATIPTTGIVLAYSTVPGEPRPLAMSPMDLMRHLYIPGTTGVGKTTTLENISVQWANLPEKHGFTFLDPHGDASERLLNLLPRHRMQDVIYVNPLDTECPVGINPLRGDNPSLVASFMMGVIESLFGTGMLTGDYMRNAIYTIALQGNMTLHEVVLVLEDPMFRDEVTRDLRDEHLRRFWTAFEGLSRAEQAKNVEPVMRRLRPFLMPELRGVFGQSGGIDMRSVIDDGKILVVNLSKGSLGDGPAYIVGSMIVAALWQATLSRSNIPESQRRPHLLLADEFQNLVKLPTGWGDITNEARKYRLGLVLANQLMDDIREIRTHILANTNKLILRPAGIDAALLAREMGLKDDYIKNLGRHQAVLSLTNDGHTARPVTGNTLPPAELVGLGNAIKAASRSQHGEPREDIELEIAARRKPRPVSKRLRPRIGAEE